MRGIVLAAAAMVIASGALLFLWSAQNKNDKPKDKPRPARIDAGIAAVAPAPVVVPAKIKGRVLGNGAPAEGASVSLSNQLGQAVTAADGTYELVGYQLGFAELVAEDRRTGFRGERAVEVKSGVDLDGQDITMAGSARMKITVKDLDDKPVVGALVGVWGRGATTSYFAGAGSRTDDKGMIERIGLVPGGVTVSAQIGKEPPTLARVSIMSINTPVEVNLVIPRRRGKPTTGILRDDRGTPVAGVTLTGAHKTDKAGKFEIKNLLEGTYSFEIVEGKRAVNVEVESGTRDNVIVLPRAGTLELALKGFGDANIDIEPVDIEPSPGPETLFASDHTPTFRDLRAGTYRLRGSNATSVGSTKVSIRPGETTRVQLTPTPPVTIKGVAHRFPDRAPLANLVCRSDRASSKTDATGRFTITPVAAGELRVECSDPASGVSTSGKSTFTATANQTVEVIVDVVVSTPADRGAADCLGARVALAQDKKTYAFFDVEPSGPAQAAGIGEGDTLVTVEGRAVSGREAETAVSYLLSRPRGKAVAVGVRPKAGSYVVDLSVVPK